MLVLPAVAMSGVGLLTTAVLGPGSARAIPVPVLLTSVGAVAPWAALDMIGLALPN